MEDTAQSDVTALTVQLLSAYLGNNTVAPAELADLIRSTRTVLSEPQTQTDAESASEVHTPAVSVRKSLANPEYLISLIDGKPYKTLKRHLTSHNLTPETYRKRYNLPANYPMVAPAFAEKRREIAAAIGLGRRPRASKPETSKAPDAAEAEANASTLSDTKDQAASTLRGKQADQSRSATTKQRKPRTSAKASSASETATPAKGGESDRGDKPAEKKQSRGRGKLKLKLSGSETVQGDAGSPSTSSETGANAAAADSSGKSKPARRMARPKTEGTDAKD